MQTWITLLAAVGGLVLGIGVGVALGRRGAAALRDRLRAAESRTRSQIVPVLEARAVHLGVSATERSSFPSDVFATAAGLADAIRAHEDRANIAFSDTVQADRTRLEGRRS